MRFMFRLLTVCAFSTLLFPTYADDTGMSPKGWTTRKKQAAASVSTMPQNEPPKFTVELRDGSRVVGTPSIPSIPIQTSFAKVEIPLKLIEAIQYDESREKALILCVNGDRIEGVINLNSIQVNAAFGKTVIPLKSVIR